MDCFASLAMTVKQARLPLLPPTPMPRRATTGTRRRPELWPRLAGVGGLEDFAAAGVGRGFARPFATRAVGQGFGAVHFVEVGFVDLGRRGGWTTAAAHPALCAYGARPSPSREG